MPAPTLSERALSLQESAIRKLDLTVALHPHVRWYRVNIGQPDVPTPRPLLEAVQNWDVQVVGYGPASGIPAVREAAARYHGKWSPDLDARHVAVTTGGSEALLFAFTALCDPGDEVLVPEPYYTNYNGFASVVGARVRPIATRLEDGFALPSDEILDAAITPRTRAIVFSNPGNPTGAVYGRETLERVLTWAKRHGIFVIADEVYRRIWFEEPPTSALEFEDFHEHVIVVDSLSKTYSACGARLGFLISRNAQLMEKIERLGQARLGPQPLAQQFALAALSLPETYYEEVRGIYRRRVDALMDALGDLEGVHASRPAGAFYAMLDLPVDNSESFARWMVESFRDEGEGLVIAPGPGFYSSPDKGQTQARVAAVLREADLRRAVELLGKGLAAYPGRT